MVHAQFASFRQLQTCSCRSRNDWLPKWYGYFCLHPASFSLISEQIAEYISPLLDRAREIGIEVFLKATAASFRESWRMVDMILEVSRARPESTVTRTQAEDVMWVSLHVFRRTSS